MGQHILVITGADSNGNNRNEDISHLHRYPDFDSARDKALEWEAIWQQFGFALAPSGLYTKGSIWRRCVLIDDHGMQWYLGGVSNVNNTIKRGA